MITLQEKINNDLKTAMIAKDADKLRTLRLLKSAIQLKATEKPNVVLTDDDVLNVIQKSLKTRRDSATVYKEQNREDLAKIENDEITVLESYLPKQLSFEEVTEVVKVIVAQLGATTIKEMGKVMGVATKQLAGQVDNQTISNAIRALLTA